MGTTVVILIWLMAVTAVIWLGVRSMLRERALRRLGDPLSGPSETSPLQQGRRWRRRWIWIPWLVGAVTVGLVWLVLNPPLPYLVATGVLVVVIGSQVEAFFHQRMAVKFETQLAEAIDILIGAVGAGASVSTALVAAIADAKAPLRPYLEELAGRIRLGDDPQEVFRSLAARIPSENFLLFTSTLAVHWEVGGSLTSTLASVGRTIRDRNEVSQRIQSNIVQSQFSTLAIVALTYFIAAVVWRNGPEQMQEFVGSSLGGWFVAGSIVLQSVGVVWMNLISRPRF